MRREHVLVWLVAAAAVVATGIAAADIAVDSLNVLMRLVAAAVGATGVAAADTTVDCLFGWPWY